MIRAPVAVLVAALVTATTADLRAQPEPLAGDVKERFDKALADFRDKDYEAAAAGFAEVYEAAPRFDVLFAWAQASRLAGDCAKALELYHRLKRDHDLTDRDRAAVEGLDVDGRLGRGRAFGASSPEPGPDLCSRQ